MDSFAWKIVRLPLPPYFLTLPFFSSAVLVTLAGYVCVPLLDRMKVHEPIRRLGLVVTHSRRQTIPTMGGLFFVPVGVLVAIAMTKFSSIEVAGAAAVTVLFAAIGLVDDSLSLCSDNNNGLSAKLQLFLEVLLTDSYFIFFAYRRFHPPDLFYRLVIITGSGRDMFCVLVGGCKHIISLWHV